MNVDDIFEKRETGMMKFICEMCKICKSVFEQLKIFIFQSLFSNVLLLKTQVAFDWIIIVTIKKRKRGYIYIYIYRKF